jgi:putative zinc finger/helix-turn-helix YgiT family protein
MFPKKCAECGGAVVSSNDPLSFEVRGESVLVGGIEHGACEQCAEVYLSLDAAEQLQIAALGKAKAARGLLSPSEIRELRQSLSLSQAAFEDLLGVGAKTVVRWEKGTVFQSATADRLMRLLRYMPALSEVLKSGVLYEGRDSCLPRSM